ncbi:MAG TPA: sialate O-acetylesterase [Luteolibacter sp.]|nr:sialate O-acetylesterase [Luteolibacter sp.]
MKEKQTKNPAIVFMVAGQSNAGGCGVFSPELHKELGRDKKCTLTPGSTASEVGLPTRAEDYTHSYIWVHKKGFERLDPMTNVRPREPGIKFHGMELPVVHQLEALFPDNDIYVFKHAPNGRNLHSDWNPKTPNGHYSRWLEWCRTGLAELNKEYPEVRVVGFYWDQGEADGGVRAQEYEGHLKNFIATFRKDIGLPKLKFFVRKHLFRDMETLVAAQQAVDKDDPLVFLLDIDQGSPEKNFAAWSYTPNDIHLSSKAFVTLSQQLFTNVLKDPKIENFELLPPP